MTPRSVTHSRQIIHFRDSASRKHVKRRPSRKAGVFRSFELRCALAFASFAFVVFCAMTAIAGTTAELGKAMFFKENRSMNGTQSCASCPDPAAGFAADDVAFIPGALGGHEKRVAPSAAYAFMSPALHHVMEDSAPLFVSGLFHESRATENVTLIALMFQIFLWLTRECHLWQDLSLDEAGWIYFISWYLAPISLVSLLIERASTRKIRL